MGKLFLAFKIGGISFFAVVALFLIVFSLPFTGWKALAVQTGSMEPAIPAGSLVLVHNVPASQLRIGDILTYKSSQNAGQTITHRLVGQKGQENGPKQYVVKGDANKVPDAPVPQNQIVGRTELSVPYMGRVLDALKTPLGLALVVYLPALLLFIAEIRLLVQRLAKLEIAKQQAVLRPQVVGAAPAMPALRPMSLHLDPERKARPKSKLVSLLLVASLTSTLLVGNTYASLSSTATLTGNTIATQASGTLNHLVIVRVDFPGAPNDPISFQPITYIFNPSRRDTIDMSGWSLQSSTGEIFYFNQPTPIYPRQRMDVHSGPSGYLRIGGDHLALKDAEGNVVDSLGWGTDTTQFDPAIQGVVARKHVNRVTNTTDTNTASDWEVRL